MASSSARSLSSRLQVYTDGGADPNPGPAGWGAVILDHRGAPVQELSGGEEHSTNNRMELTAAIRALEAVDPGTPVRLFTDSTYLKKGITEWLPGWIARGWRRRTGSLQNEDLWRRLAELEASHDVEWRWVKGHAGHEHNERADELATREIARRRGDRRSKGAGGADAAQSADVEVLLRVSGGRGPGGWAATIRRGDEAEVLSGAIAQASANEIDVLAAAEVLEALPQGEVIAVYSGSDYLRNGATQWLAKWQRSGWKTKAGTPVKNQEAWQRLARMLDERTVHWPSVKAKKPAGWKELGKIARDAVHG